MKTGRMFFALWPTDEVRRSIVETYSQLSPPLKGQVMQRRNLHLTLQFLGSVSAEVKDCMQVAAGTIKMDPFEISLNCFGVFPKAKIFWMGCQHVPVELIQLNKTLAEAIETCGYQHDERVYTPHVTLLRKCVNPVLDQDAFSIPWVVNEFALIESCADKQGINYQVIEKYALA